MTDDLDAIFPELRDAALLTVGAAAEGRCDGKPETSRSRAGSCGPYS